jgi:hypothetical protein
MFFFLPVLYFILLLYLTFAFATSILTVRLRFV